MAALDCSRSFAYALIKRGEFKVVRLGDAKGIRVTQKSVDRYIRRMIGR
ncbi:MAG: helix-turn-helix domain-containing protein [Desulfovibrio sp.]